MTDEDAAVARQVASIWERMRPKALERLAEVRAALEMLSSGSVVEEQRASAESMAHKLAGALGTYGFPRGSEVARQAEFALADPASLDAGSLRDLLASLDAVADEIGGSHA